MVKDSSYLLTIGTKKKEILDNIYNSIFDKEELKNLIIKYPDTYIVNPLELEEKIKDNNYDILKQKNIIIMCFQENSIGNNN